MKLEEVDWEKNQKKSELRQYPWESLVFKGVQQEEKTVEEKLKEQPEKWSFKE